MLISSTNQKPIQLKITDIYQIKKGTNYLRLSPALFTRLIAQPILKSIARNYPAINLCYYPRRTCIVEKQGYQNPRHHGT